MGLMQLLTVGRSLGKIEDQPSRYRMAQQNLLPKFGSAKGGDSGEPEEPAIPKAGPSKSPRIAEPPDLARSVTTQKTFENKTNDMNTIEAASPNSSAVAPVTPQHAFPLGRWTLFKNPFSKTSKPKANPAPVQGELSLDMVTPVRNDLSDSDLEVIPAITPRFVVMSRAPEPTKPAQEPEVPQASEPEPESAGLVWNRIKTQYFGAGNTSTE
jgi:hypothetical protein